MAFPWSKKRLEEVVVTTRESVPKEPVATMAAIEPADNELRAQYLEAAKVIGLDSSIITNIHIKEFLQENHIPTYNHEAVENYLDHKLGMLEWCWKGVRAIDVTHARAHQVFHHTYKDHDLYGKRQYGKAIPYPVLLTMGKIIGAFPDVRYFISDQKEAADFKDPFLRIVINGEGYIVERWDEPGFRDKGVAVVSNEVTDRKESVS